MEEIEGLRQVRLRYLNGNRRVKAEILRSLEALHGYHHKSAIRVPALGDLLLLAKAACIDRCYRANKSPIDLFAIVPEDGSS